MCLALPGNILSIIEESGLRMVLTSQESKKRKIFMYILQGIKFLMVSLLLPAYLYSSNGPYDIGVGAKAKGMGGTAVAYALDTFASLANPANLADLDDRIDNDSGWLYHKQWTTVRNVPQALQDIGVRNAKYPFNGARSLLYGAWGISHVLNEEFTAGLLFSGISGGTIKAQDPHPPIPPNVGKPFFTGNHVRAFNVAMTPMLSYRPCCNPRHSFGIGVDLTAGMINATNFQNLSQGVFGFLAVQNTSAHPHHITNRGWDYAWGAAVRLGWLWHVNSYLKVGLSYRSKTFMSRYKQYQGLITPQGRGDFPEVLSAGFSLKLDRRTTLAFDFARIFNSRVPSLANHTPAFAIEQINGQFVPILIHPHGANNGSAFGWKSQNVYKVGLNFDLHENLSFRAGYNYSKTCVPKFPFASSFLPAVIEHHICIGWTLKWKRCSELSFCYVRGIRNTVNGHLAPPLKPASAEAQFHLAEVEAVVTAQTDQISLEYSILF